jgi:hypothetical protein
MVNRFAVNGEFLMKKNITRRNSLSKENSPEGIHFPQENLTTNKNL